MVLDKFHIVRLVVLIQKIDLIKIQISTPYTIYIQNSTLNKKNEITNLDELVLTCNEEDERNSENKLTCTSDIYTLDYKYQEQDDYSIKITYDNKDKNQNTWSEEYSELVDFIDIKIESWQLTEENTNERKA